MKDYRQCRSCGLYFSAKRARRLQRIPRSQFRSNIVDTSVAGSESLVETSAGETVAPFSSLRSATDQWEEFAAGPYEETGFGNDGSCDPIDAVSTCDEHQSMQLMPHHDSTGISSARDMDTRAPAVPTCTRDLMEANDATNCTAPDPDGAGGSIVADVVPIATNAASAVQIYVPEVRITPGSALCDPIQLPYPESTRSSALTIQTCNDVHDDAIGMHVTVVNHDVLPQEHFGDPDDDPDRSDSEEEGNHEDNRQIDSHSDRNGTDTDEDDVDDDAPPGLHSLYRKPEAVLGLLLGAHLSSGSHPSSFRLAEKKQTIFNFNRANFSPDSTLIVESDPEIWSGGLAVSVKKNFDGFEICAPDLEFIKIPLRLARTHRARYRPCISRSHTASPASHWLLLGDLEWNCIHVFMLFDDDERLRTDHRSGDETDGFHARFWRVVVVPALRKLNPYYTHHMDLTEAQHHGGVRPLQLSPVALREFSDWLLAGASEAGLYNIQFLVAYYGQKSGYELDTPIGQSLFNSIRTMFDLSGNCTIDIGYDIFVRPSNSNAESSRSSNRNPWSALWTSDACMRAFPKSRIFRTMLTNSIADGSHRSRGKKHGLAQIKAYNNALRHMFTGTALQDITLNVTHLALRGRPEVNLLGPVVKQKVTTDSMKKWKEGVDAMTFHVESMGQASNSARVEVTIRGHMLDDVMGQIDEALSPQAVEQAVKNGSLVVIRSKDLESWLIHQHLLVIQRMLAILRARHTRLFRDPNSANELIFLSELQRFMVTGKTNDISCWKYATAVRFRERLKQFNCFHVDWLQCSPPIAHNYLTEFKFDRELGQISVVRIRRTTEASDAADEIASNWNASTGAERLRMLRAFIGMVVDQFLFDAKHVVSLRQDEEFDVLLSRSVPFSVQEAYDPVAILVHRLFTWSSLVGETSTWLQHHHKYRFRTCCREMWLMLPSWLHNKPYAEDVRRAAYEVLETFPLLRGQQYLPNFDGEFRCPSRALLKAITGPSIDHSGLSLGLSNITTRIVDRAESNRQKRMEGEGAFTDTEKEEFLELIATHKLQLEKGSQHFREFTTFCLDVWKTGIAKNHLKTHLPLQRLVDADLFEPSIFETRRRKPDEWQMQPAIQLRQMYRRLKRRS